jgi:hypothetical protein
MTWTTLITPSRVPAWSGERRVHRPLDIRGKTGNYGYSWTPWTLLAPGVALPRRFVIERLWAVLGGAA